MQHSYITRSFPACEVRTAAVIVLATLIMGGAFHGESRAQSARVKYFNVERDGNALAITWETEREEHVSVFQVFRKAGFDADFVVVGTSSRHGVDLQYKLVDDQVYKTGGGDAAFLDYRLEVVFESGVRQRLAEKKINYTSTAIRRSWGSIKAMFQD